MKRLFTAALSILLTLGSLASLPPAPMSLPTVGTASAQAQQPQNKVTIQNLTFTPASLTVTPGTTVTWTNQDSVAHTVTADSGNGPNSGQLQRDQTYTFKFDQPGTYAYHCSIHPQMKAKIVVAGAGGQGQAAPQPISPMQTAPTGGSGAGGTGTGGNVATGPVDTGSGSTAGMQYAPALVGGMLALFTAALILASRQSRNLKS